MSSNPTNINNQSINAQGNPITTNPANQKIASDNQKQQSDTKWSIKLDQNEKDYIILIGHTNFPTLLEYSKIRLAEQKIQHLIIQDMYFQFLDKQIKITFSKASLGDLNPYKVFLNIYEKIASHQNQLLLARTDFIKNLDIYPQVVHYLGTPISYEIFFRFSQYKYSTDNKYKEEHLRVSNILSYDIYDEVRHDYEGNCQGYEIQQTLPDCDMDHYLRFQHTFKRNLFYGLSTHLKIEQIYTALESQYVPYFIVQKIFLQLEEFYRPTYQLSPQELQSLIRMVGNISMFPSFACILFIPHNAQRKQRWNNDKLAGDKLESKSFMQIRFDQCNNCNEFTKEVHTKCNNLKKEYMKAIQNLSNTDPSYAQKLKMHEDKFFESLQQLKVACKSTNIQHSYQLKISFSDMFYYLHTQRSQEATSGTDKRVYIQESQLRSFDIFEKVFAKNKNQQEEILRFNHEKQQITFTYTNQIELELNLLSFLSLIYQLHFIYQYYYYYSQRLTNQSLVDVKFQDTNLKKDSVVMRISQQNSPYELQLYVEYDKLQLVVFNTHIRGVENVSQSYRTFIQLQSWLFKVFIMNPYLKAEAAYTYLSKGNKLIIWLQRDENKSQKIISLYQDLMSINLQISCIDLTGYDDEDQNMKDQTKNSEDMFKKLLEINFDIEKKNQLVIYKEGQYAFFQYQVDSFNNRILQNRDFNPNLNIFSDRGPQIIQFLRNTF